MDDAQAQQDLQDLTDEVAQVATVGGSIITLLNGTVAANTKLLATATDFATLKAGLEAQNAALKANIQPLSDAVTQNTPAAPTS